MSVTGFRYIGGWALAAYFQGPPGAHELAKGLRMAMDLSIGTMKLQMRLAISSSGGAGSVIRVFRT